jgi:cell volume regulation protein A
MANIAITVTYFAILLGFGVLIANVLKKRKVPDTFFLLMLGLLLGPTVFMNPAVTSHFSIKLVDVGLMGDVPDFLRILALIIVVFTGTFNLSFGAFKKFSDSSIKLAFIGVFFNTILFGIASSMLFGLQPVYAFLLGAALSGTAEGVIHMSDTIVQRCKNGLTIIDLESILNSPLTVLLPMLFLDLVFIQPGALIEPLKYMVIFWQMIAAGVGTGLLVGFAASKMIKSMMKEYGPLLVIAIALISYALAENVGGSGMLSVAICGLIMGNMISKEQGKDEMNQFDNQFSEMLRISVFTLLGAQVMLPLTAEGLNMIFTAFLFFILVFLSRPIFLMPIIWKQRKTFTKKEVILLNFISPRGVSEAAMAPIIYTAIISVPNLANATSIAGNIINIIFLVIMFSVLFSSFVSWLMGGKRFDYLDATPPEEKENYQEVPEEKEPEKPALNTIPKGRGKSPKTKGTKTAVSVPKGGVNLRNPPAMDEDDQEEPDNMDEDLPVPKGVPAAG